MHLTIYFVIIIIIIIENNYFISYVNNLYNLYLNFNLKNQYEINVIKLLLLSFCSYYNNLSVSGRTTIAWIIFSLITCDIIRSNMNK